jgi:hypothetical protein
MNQQSTMRPLVAAILATATMGITCTAASARPDIGESAPATVCSSGLNCAIARVGLQIVRGDNLSGAGAAAPLWLPRA